MIDIHNHILPGIDDGSKSTLESINIIKKAYSVGVTDIIITPHFILNTSYDTKIEQQLLEMLQNELQNNKININLYLGNEVFVEHNLLELLNEKKFNTLNNSRYLLFELSLNNFYQGIFDLLFQLRSNGIEPIIAHPERYSYLQKNPELAFKLLNHGAIFQLDVGSFYGNYGKNAKKLFMLLITHHAASFIATDTHRQSDVYYDELKNIQNDLEKYISKEEINILINNNPKKVIKNEMIDKLEIVPLKKTIFGKFK